MAIYRGTGGTGDSTTDTTVTTVTEKAAEAASSATSAANSATSAANSASSASTSATNAATSETNAANSATASATSATASETAKTAAQAAQTAAETAQANAETAEANAVTAKNQAVSAKDNAVTAQTAAETAETNAETAYANTLAIYGSTTDVQNAVDSASASATTATTKAAEAASSATDASNYSSSAGTSATQAASSASQAATSAASANSYATDAQTAQTAAETAQAAAEAAEYNINGLYLGSLADDPTLDGNGVAVTTGDLYFNTTEQEVRVYTDGDVWEPVVDLAGDITVNSLTSNNDVVVKGNLEVQGTTITVDSATAQTIDLGDNDKIRLGDLDDLQIYHDGTDSYIANTTGTLKLSGNTHVTGNITVSGTVDGRDIAADGTTLDAVASTYVDVSGDTMTGDLAFGDNVYAKFGDDDDLQIYHNASNSVIRDAGTGSLSLQSNGEKVGIWNYSQSHNMANFYNGGRVELFYGGSEKFRTTSSGVDITGVLTTDGITTSADVSFGDNVKAKFGASDDLVIEHNGTNSLIKDQGTGDLLLLGNNLKLGNTFNTETYLYATVNGAVSLYYDNASKLATTSSGVDITGTVVADGLTVDGDVTLTNSTSGNHLVYIDSTTGNSRLVFSRDGTDRWNIGYSTSGAVFNIYDSVAGATRLAVDDNGDISFYDDAGTSQDFYWDASTSRLGLGTTSPDGQLDVRGTSLSDILVKATSANSQARVIVENDARAYSTKINASDLFQIKDETADAARLTIDTSGNVGIGTTSPSGTLSIDSTGVAQSVITTSTDGSSYVSLDIGGYVGTPSIPREVSFFTNVTGEARTERMRIDSSGRVGIGTTSPDKALVVEGVGAEIVINDTDTTDTPLLRFRESGSTSGTILTNSSNLIFTSGTTEAMRIDSSGNLLVGTTSTLAGAGVELRSDGQIVAIRSNNRVAWLNRTGSDGSIVDFLKDGNTVGSIGAKGGDLYVGTGDIGLRFNDASNAIVPVNTSTTAITDGLAILGGSTYRFKDLYLSGGVYLGGVGSSNLLDDYEEGTWTPVVTHVSGFASTSITQTHATYTKVGRKVTLQLEFSLTDSTGNVTAGDDIVLTAACLPFSVLEGGIAGGVVGVQSSMSTGENVAMGYAGFSASGQLGMLFHTVDGTVARNQGLGGTVTYFTS